MPVILTAFITAGKWDLKKILYGWSKLSIKIKYQINYIKMNLSDQELKKFKTYDQLEKYIDDNEDERGGSLTLASIGVGISKVIAFFKWANMMFDAQQKHSGERHTFLLVNGIPRIASFAGRGTHILQRLKDKDKPISVVDLIAKIHDIQYIQSQLAKTKAEQMKIVRKADDEMLKMLQIAKEFKLDNFLNIALCHFIIKQKTRLEDKNILFLSDKLRSIAGDLITLPKEDIKLLQESKKNAVDEFYSLVKKQKKKFSKNTMKGGALDDSKKGTIQCTCGCPESKLKQRIHPTYHLRSFTPTY